MERELSKLRRLLRSVFYLGLGITLILGTTIAPVIGEASTALVCRSEQSKITCSYEEEVSEFVKGHIIVKFKESLIEPADLIFSNGLRFADKTSSSGNELDRLNSKYRVKSIKPVFASLFSFSPTLPGKGAMAERKKRFLGSINNSKAEHPVRSKRAPENAEIPDFTNIYIFEVPDGTDIQQMSLEYAANPNIEYSSPDYIAKVQAIPNDPYFSSSGSWGQLYDDLWGLKKISASQAWDSSTGLGAVVAVVDTGLDHNHLDIVGNVWANTAEVNGSAGVDDDGNGFIDDIRGWDFAYGDNDPTDLYGHGTHVSGTIAAVGNNGIGVIGVAYQSKIMPVKGLNDYGSGSFSNLANAITYAAQNGADVINNSWGCWGCASDSLIVDAVNLANSLGCVVTFAAGNYNVDVKYFFPANIQDVITVASSGADDSRSYFSNWGYMIDVAAPGGGPDAASPPYAFRNILSLRAQGTGDTNLVVGTNYLRQAGTSMATPHVSGVAALLLSLNPNLTVAEIASIIKHTAQDQVGDPLIDTPGYDPYYGWGRLDAASAIVSAFNPPADPPLLKVIPDQLEYYLPQSLCNDQWSLPIDIYNFGGGELNWYSSAPSWLTLNPPSGMAPSFISASVSTLANQTGILTISSPDVTNGTVDISVSEQVVNDINITNCNTIISQAFSNQQWDPQHNIFTNPPGIKDGSGGAIYVWVDTRYGNPDLFVQRVDSSGIPLWTANGVQLTSASGAEIRPAILSDGAGGAIIAWSEGGNNGLISDKHIRAQRVNASGQKLWGVEGVWVSQAAGGQWVPKIISDGTGGAIMSWQDYRNGNSDIYAQRIDSNGTALWQTDGVPVTRAVDAQFSDAIASDGNSGAIVTWMDRRTGWYAIYAQHIDMAGNALWAIDGILIGTQLISSAGPNIVSDGSGGAIIAWHDFRNVQLNPSGVTVLSRSDIYAARVNGAGQNVWAEGGIPVVLGLTVSPSTYVPGWAPDQITMTSDGQGGIFVVWHDSRNASWDIYSQHLNAQGNALWATNGVPVTTASETQMSPAIISDGENGAIYAWSDYRSGSEYADIFIQRLNNVGSRLWGANGVWVQSGAWDKLYPYMVPLTNNRFLITWDDWRNYGNYINYFWIDLLGRVIDYQTTCPDADGDGYTFCGGDCNDSNALINPGATEMCDSIDNNCNGQIDEGVQNTYYRDADSDGYGNAADSIQACTQPAGFVTNSTDCNDANVAINPSATEVCDSIDNNCNGQIDEGVQNTYYRDADSDGYGNAAQTTQVCTQPAGYVTNSTDCNDNNASVYPGAPEVKLDGIDQDCNGYDLTIVITSAKYTSRTDSLSVSATSNLGSSANLVLVGYGAMKYKNGVWSITVRQAGGNPGTVTVSGIEGSTSAPTTVK